MRKHSPLSLITGKNNFGKSEVMRFKMLESIPKVHSFMPAAFLWFTLVCRLDPVRLPQKDPAYALQEGERNFAWEGFRKQQACELHLAGRRAAWQRTSSQ